MRKGERHIQNAAAKTLNTVAFDTLPELVDQAESDMDFKRKAKQALGFGVKKARPGPQIVAQLWTRRGWLFTHVEPGVRSAKKGWKVGGVPMILVPREEKAFTRRGDLKARFKRSLYVIPSGAGALVLYRPKRRNSKAELIAILTPKARHADDFEPEKVAQRVFNKKANRLLNYYLGLEHGR